MRSPVFQPEIHERRGATRFPLRLELQCRPLRSKKKWGRGRGKDWIITGQTFNISSNGVLFSAPAEDIARVRANERVKLEIAWPVLLDGECRLKLIVQGAVVRREVESIALAITKYAFRTTRQKAASKTLMDPLAAPVAS